MTARTKPTRPTDRKTCGRGADVGRVRMPGMVWNHPDAAFEDGPATAPRRARRHGHTAAQQAVVQGGGRGVEEGGAVAGDGAAAARAPRRGRGAWETAFTAAVAYRQREGDLEIPRAHVETVAVETAAGAESGAGGGGGVVEARLGKWVDNQRSRRSSLGEERVGLLTELGMRW
ncbi:helicase associated domain-containing protein [Embleya sp. NPDC056575]|uniref:helicase associated domain-containing protein n=1 Tax=unclassified Embleya TaxID=2699296 RepID=UPI003688ECB4